MKVDNDSLELEKEIDKIDSESINEAKESTRKIVEDKVDEKIDEILGN